MCHTHSHRVLAVVCFSAFHSLDSLYCSVIVINNGGFATAAFLSALRQQHSYWGLFSALIPSWDMFNILLYEVVWRTNTCDAAATHNVTLHCSIYSCATPKESKIHWYSQLIDKMVTHVLWICLHSSKQTGWNWNQGWTLSSYPGGKSFIFLTYWFLILNETMLFF